MAKNRAEDKLKAYTHKEYALLDPETGKVALLRCSFDEERMFIRSANVFEDGKFVPINGIIMSDQENELVNPRVGGVPADEIGDLPTINRPLRAGALGQAL